MCVSLSFSLSLSSSRLLEDYGEHDEGDEEDAEVEDVHRLARVENGILCAVWCVVCVAVVGESA